ncbi:MAG: DciA family protein [Solirubrobacterales bacterium]
MKRRDRPRQAGSALRRLVEDAAPQTLLAAVQAAWPRAAGETVASQAEPVSERDGEVTISCRTASWAQELDLLQGSLLEQLNQELGEAKVSGLRFTADGARHGI